MKQTHTIPQLSDDRLTHKEVIIAHKLVERGRSFIREILDPNFGYRTSRELIGALQRELSRYAPEAEITVIKRRDPYKKGTGAQFYDETTRADVEVDEALIGSYPMLENGNIFIPILTGAKYVVIRNLGDKAKELFHTVKSGVAREYDRSSRLIAQLNQDKLTGAYNRQFIEAFGREYTPESMEKSGKKFVIFGIDLNAFKEINDQLGHDIGDKALIAATEVLEKVFGREGDYVCRMSGDEFVVIIDASDWDEKGRSINTEIFKRKIHGELRKVGSSWIPPERTIDNPPSLGMSIGVGLMDGSTGLQKALIDADLAMLREKPELGGVLRIARKLKDIKNLSLIPLVLHELKEIPGIEAFQAMDKFRLGEIVDELAEIFQRNGTVKK